MSPGTGVARHNIQLADLARFLHRRGWTKAPSDNHPDFNVFQPPDGIRVPGLTLVLPKSPELPEAPKRIQEALRLLAMIDEVTTEEIARQVRGDLRDILHFQLRDEIARGGVLPLTYAAQAVQSLRSLVAYARMMEDNPRYQYREISDSGREMAEQFLFGQTFIGSFGFTVEAPLDQFSSTPGQLGFLEPTESPMARRVVVRIARGFAYASDSTRVRQTQTLIEGVDQGWNVNMLRAASNLIEHARPVRLSLSVHWSSKIEPPDDLQSLESMYVSHESRPYLDEAAERLAESADERDAHIEGKVITVHFDHSNARLLPLEEYAKILRPEDPRAPRVTVRHLDVEHGDIAVRVPVAYEELQRISKALEFGSTSVSVDGTLRRIANYWFLKNPRNLRILGAA